MTDLTVSQLPSNDTINAQAEAIGMMIFQVSTETERQPLYEYGRCLLARVEPPSGLTLRFYAALSQLAPRLPDYQAFTRDHVLYASAISALQCRLAVHIARSEYPSVVLR